MLMATQTKRWTLEELHRLPDDGNKYELVRGNLFVTPAPTEAHETILARLTMILVPYVAANELGLVYRPRAVVRFDGSEVEPDLMVRQLLAAGRSRSMSRNSSRDPWMTRLNRVAHPCELDILLHHHIRPPHSAFLEHL